MPIMATLVQHGALAWHCGNDMHLQGKPLTTHQSGMDYSNLHVICVQKGQKLCMIPMVKSTTRPHHQIRSMLDKHGNHKPRYES